MACMFFYFATRVVVFVSSEYSFVDSIFAFFLMIAEGHMILHTLGFAFNIFYVFDPDRRREPNYTLKGSPLVHVIVPARHEPKAVLEKTFQMLALLRYANKEIFLLDDSSDPVYQREAEEVAQRFGAQLFRREPRHGAKAGIVNDFLQHSDAKYVAVFDADQTPMPDFLEKVVPILEHDTQLAFVQTPQFYANLNNRIARCACVQQSIFYEYICEGKSASNAMFCCGTNVVFRSSALKSVGGFDESSVTEDFATSILIHLKGYKSLYYNHAAAFGMAPESLLAYFKQQTRWATGCVDVCRRIAKKFLMNPRGLTPRQWMEYFLSGSYYFIGWTFFILMLSPVLYLFFGIPRFFAYPNVYFLTFMPYITLSLILFLSTMMDRRYSFTDIYRAVFLGFNSFPIYMRASFLGLIGKKIPFAITDKGKTNALPLITLWPQWTMILANVTAIFIGVVRIYYRENPYAIGVNIFWAAYHTFVLSHIFYFNKRPV
ncbi:MAG: hypothetical protein A2Y14_03340 [Verrucomicrobia bacterium GWF2_51_19]|nr:MAG: hypothetical protein A2Y14_03340 [Verrucomicrobia bacterium GWF2_51_19]